MAAVLDEAKFFQLDKYLCDPKFANSPRYHLTFKRDRTYRLAMKQEQGCLVNCLFVVRDSDRLIVKEIRESSMRLLVDVKLENGDIKAKDYVLYDPHQPRQVPVLRGGHIYTFRLGLPTDISRGVPIPTMDIIFQELLVFGEHEQLVDISANSDRD
ncbi:uncharacterized protein LOC134196907 [Corticium candelabrum]|uniref:uncharacterized protein LOC134196907 n=1 Tax=Corticium candelabrum TaxID=121492 RepID=UPI002E27381F|nr:uncharacterized protein LOC134196907 [Corticium candelabrum]